MALDNVVNSPPFYVLGTFFTIWTDVFDNGCLRQCGVNVILNRIKEDMDALYNGVKMKTSSGQKTIYGALVSVCGDTLAQHELAGFKEGVGFAYSKCRHCECSFEDMQSHFNEDAC